MMSSEQLSRLMASLVKWQATPYLAGQCLAGLQGGVDCIRYVDAVLQDVFDKKPEPLPVEAQDAALHNPEVVQRIARLIAVRFSMRTVDPLGIISPADIICTRTKTKSGEKLTPEEILTKTPHHVFLAGFGPLCWHALQRVGVCSMGIGAMRSSFNVIQVWRSELA